MNRDRLMVSS